MSHRKDRGRRPRRLVNIVLLLASLACCLLALELFCRLAPSDSGEVQLNDPYRYVKTIGRPRRFAPLNSYGERIPLEFDQQGYYAPSNGVVRFHSNQFGARWIEAAEQPLAARTVLVLGDSFTYGHGLHYEDAFVFRLQQLLEGEGAEVSFLNFAHRGANAKQVLRNYEDVRTRAVHQEVLYPLNINDLVWFPASHFVTNPLSVPWLVEHWKGYAFISGRIHRWLIRRQRIRQLVSSSVFEREAFAANMAALTRLDRAASAHGTPLTVAILPILVDLKKGTFHPLYDGIRERVEAVGIECIDLTRCLDGRPDSDLWVLPFDQHPNAVANQVFAEELLEQYR